MFFLLLSNLVMCWKSLLCNVTIPVTLWTLFTLCSQLSSSVASFWVFINNKSNLRKLTKKIKILRTGSPTESQNPTWQRYSFLAAFLCSGKDFSLITENNPWSTILKKTLTILFSSPWLYYQYLTMVKHNAIYKNKNQVPWRDWTLPGAWEQIRRNLEEMCCKGGE